MYPGDSNATWVSFPFSCVAVRGDSDPMCPMGFTLLEVMAAIFVLAVGILALDAMQLSSIRGNATAGSMSEAMILGRRHLETLLRLPYDHPALEDIIGHNAPEFPGPQSHPPEHQAHEGGYTISWNVTDDFLAPGTKSILLAVSWADGAVRRSVFLEYLISSDS